MNNKSKNMMIVYNLMSTKRNHIDQTLFTICLIKKKHFKLSIIDVEQNYFLDKVTTRHLAHKCLQL